MWFKNLKLYRLSPGTDLSQSGLNAALGPCEFQPCGNQDSQSNGWVPPDHADGWLVYRQADQSLIRLRTERRLLPASVINQASRERALHIEEQQGYKPGRKQMKEIKEQIQMELLPKGAVVPRGQPQHL
ncbi:hypothetical protein GCM10009108_04120 [Castellaniella ginsengisoli]|uniref:Recombination-associated protein RdgC n=1 Tax=Castellaniella ginsengisoli TaxID=546114 RepID=A0ABN1KRD6_9BURK